MIQTVRMSDAGEYSVVAGSSVSKAHLMVEGRDIRITEPADREITVGEYSLKFISGCMFSEGSTSLFFPCRFWRNTEPPSSSR